MRIERALPLPSPKTPQARKLWKACVDFEAVLLGNLFKTMAPHGVLGSGSKGISNILNEHFTTELARKSAERSPLGLAKQLYAQLAEQALGKEKLRPQGRITDKESGAPQSETSRMSKATAGERAILSTPAASEGPSEARDGGVCND